MGRYILRRLVLLIPTVWLAVSLLFVIFRMVPGDPALLLAPDASTPEEIALIREQMGLNEPLYVQYVKYVWNTLHFDMGRSTLYRSPVGPQVLARLGYTLQLMVAAMSMATILGVLAGVAAAVRQGTAVDYISMLGAIAGMCAPTFWLGLMLILVFAVKLAVLPPTGYGGPKFLVLPTVTLAVHQAALIARMTRSSMLEVLREDYVRTARAKGLQESAVIFRHALKNAAIPIVTVVGLQAGLLMGGAVITEAVFAWPGMGSLLVSSVMMRDYNMVQGVVLVFALLFMSINLLVDLTYAFLNPTIRLE